MATHSGVLAWRIPGTGEPDGLPSMGSHRVGHDWSDLAAWYSLIINMCFFMAISIWFGKYLEENQRWKSMAWKLSTLPWNYSDQEEPYLPLLLSFHSITLNGRANLYHLRMLQVFWHPPDKFLYWTLYAIEIEMAVSRDSSGVKKK